MSEQPSFFQRAASLIGLGGRSSSTTDPSAKVKRPIILSRTGEELFYGGPTGQAVADSNRPIPNAHPAARSIAKLVSRVDRQPSFRLATASLFALGQASSASIEHDKNNPREAAFAKMMTDLWNDHLAKAMSSAVWGRACFEKTYLPPTDEEMLRGVSLDYLEPKKSKIWREGGQNVGVKYREKGEIDETDKDASNSSRTGIAGLTGGAGGKDDEKSEVKLQSHECYFVVVDQDSEYPQGRSMFIGAAEMVVTAMEELKRQKEIFTYKQAMGHGQLYAPSKYDPLPGQDGEQSAIDPRTGKPMDPLEDGKMIIKELQSGGSAVLPSEPHEGTTIQKWGYTPPGGSATNAQFFLDNEKKLDSEAPMSIGIPPRAIDQNSDVGSLAMSKTQLTVLERRVFSLVDPIRKAFQEQVIDPAAKVNFAAAASKFKLVVDYVSIEQFAILVELVKQIAIAPMLPPLVASGVIDLRQLLEKVRIPVGDAEINPAMLQPPMPGMMMPAPAGQPPAQPPAAANPPTGGQAALSLVGRSLATTTRTTDRRSFAEQSASIDEVAAEVAARMSARKEELLSALAEPGRVDKGKLANVFSQLERDSITGAASARMVAAADLVKRVPEDVASDATDDDTIAGGQSDDVDMSPNPQPPTGPAPLNVM